MQRRNLDYKIITGNRFPAGARTGALLLVALLIFLLPGCSGSPSRDLKEDIFIELQEKGKRKKEAVIEYFDEISDIANGAKDDDELLDCFRKMKGYYDSGVTDSPDAVKDRVERKIDLLYVNKYNMFYDILFLNNDGLVFHSVKKESDYMQNILTGPLAYTNLAKNIRQNPGKGFIDFEYYNPSREPAAFYIIPVRTDGSVEGRMILQVPINNINTILSDNSDMGRTGEVYLVNQEKLMLTNSRFIEDITILRKKITTQAVREAFLKKRGRKIITDYRGIPVYSYYEQFELFGVNWCIIAERDEAEVITNYFRENTGYFIEKILNSLSLSVSVHQGEKRWLDAGKIKRVDMDEFAMAKSGEMLVTPGVRHCTAIIVYYPDRFAYLAHVSPVDDVYTGGSLSALFLRDKRTSFLTDIIKRIQHYDIYPCEMGNLRFIVAAPHAGSIGNILEEIIDLGVDLFQIKFLFNPSAYSANVLFNQENNQILVEWKTRDRGAAAGFQYAEEVKDLEEIVKEISGYEKMTY